jgi:hypothetical protein
MRRFTVPLRNSRKLSNLHPLLQRRAVRSAWEQRRLSTALSYDLEMQFSKLGRRSCRDALPAVEQESRRLSRQIL